MNAKKIMGAVLVALLAAALFVGAASAADYGTIFLNQNLSGASGADVPTFGTTWTYGPSVVEIDALGNVILSSANFVEGKYTSAGNTITIKNPAVTVVAMGNTTAGEEYKVGTLYKGDWLNVSATPINSIDGTAVVDLKNLLITYPNGQQLKKDYSIADGTVTIFTPDESLKLSVGKYTIQAVFDTGFAAGTPASALITAPVTFEVAKATGALSVSVETVTVGDIVKLSITGQPGQTYVISGVTETTDLFEVVDGLYKLTNGKIQLPNDGKAYLNLYAKADGTATIAIKEENGQPNDDKITIKINAGDVTMKAEKDSYILGQKVKLTGTITGGNLDNAKFVMEGSNYKKQLTQQPTVDGENWELEFDTSGTDIDAGTYTITLYDAADKKKASASVALKQPFLTAEVKTPVVVQGSKLTVEGTAEAANDVAFYIFGNNKYINGTKTVDTDDSTYKIELDIVAFETPAAANEVNLSTGQYFVVIQHPMYDGKFNIGPNPAVKEEIVMNTTVGINEAGAALTQLFKVDMRQTANAAEALCQALDTQNVDDMYVKGTFIVATPTASMNPVASEITQGTKLTVSGTSNYAAGETVTVEMLSTAFAAIPKESVNSASFISLTTKTDENGNWEVTFDTTGLNVDEYTISATVGKFVTTAKVNVIEGAPTQPTEQPTQTQQPTEQPTQTEAPTTPGFGALAALAGLGAVAVLLLRRE